MKAKQYNKDYNYDNMKNYEADRLRYSYTLTKVKYSHEELVAAYLAWADKKRSFWTRFNEFGNAIEKVPEVDRRDKEWNIYCDIRDGVELGSNKRNS